MEVKIKKISIKMEPKGRRPESRAMNQGVV